MNYGEIVYAMRAACRSWEGLAKSGKVPTWVVRDLAEDLLAMVDRDENVLHDARSTLLRRRPLSNLDYCVFSTVEVALSSLSTHNEVVGAAAYDAALLASMADTAGGPHYIVDLLDTYEEQVLSEAIPYLLSREDGKHNVALQAAALELLRRSAKRKQRTREGIALTPPHTIRHLPPQRDRGSVGLQHQQPMPDPE